MSSTAEALLTGTPYLIEDGDEGADRFKRAGDRVVRIHDRAIAANESIADTAERLLSQFELAVRSDLVSESNRLEGINTSAADIRELASTREDLLRADTRAFLSFVRDDERLMESIGLYKAYELADEWAATSIRPREFELRALHSLVMPRLATSGQYKHEDLKISGADHVPTSAADVRREMTGLARWFVEGSGNPVLDATVVHAWLTHIHPFMDGNGRMARLLANLALIQAGYPPLLLRSGSDRGQYLDALAESDDGDILPLYMLFISSIRRTVKVMEHPNFVQSKIRTELLRTVEQRRQAWIGQADALFNCLDQKTRGTGWSVREMGFPELDNFRLLEERDSDGNLWFAKFRKNGRDEWLLWLGYRSDALCDVAGRSRQSWPSIFISKRTTDPAAEHPFKPLFEGDRLRPAEISLVPATAKPALVRTEHSCQEMQVDEAAARIIRALCY